MKNMKKVIGSFLALCLFISVGLILFANESNAACANSGYEDIYCTDTGCGDVGFDDCTTPFTYQ